MNNVETEYLDYEIPDRVINGVLHYWFADAWHEYDKKCLTAMLIAEQEAFMNSCNYDYSEIDVH